MRAFKLTGRSIRRRRVNGTAGRLEAAILPETASLRLIASRGDSLTLSLDARTAWTLYNSVVEESTLKQHVSSRRDGSIATASVFKFTANCLRVACVTFLCRSLVQVTVLRQCHCQQSYSQLKPRSHQQQCRSNVRLCRKNRSTCIAFDGVASTSLLMFLSYVYEIMSASLMQVLPLGTHCRTTSAPHCGRSSKIPKTVKISLF